MARSLVARYYAFRATISVGFITPIFVLFLLRDLSYLQVGTLSAMYSVLLVVLEIPTGYVGDRFGRRTSLILSVLFVVASLAGFVVAQSFLWYTLLYALWALALTFRSGSMDAWLYDALDERLDSDEFARVRGRGDAVQHWTNVVTMVAGGALYGLDPTYPFVASVAFNSLGFLALLSLPRNEQYASGGDDTPGEEVDQGTVDATEDDGTERLRARDAWTLLRTRLARPPLRSLVLYFGLFSATVSVASGYVQPMAIEQLAPLAGSLGIDVPAGGAAAAARAGEAGAALALGLGVLYAALSAVASVGGYYAGALEERLGVRGALLLVPAVTGVAMLVPSLFALVALPAFAFMKTSLPVLQPVTNGYINDRVGSAGRATTLSAASMLYSALRTPLALAAGLVAQATTATTAVGTLGGVILVGCAAVWSLGRVAPETGGTTAEDASTADA